MDHDNTMVQASLMDLGNLVVIFSFFLLPCCCTPSAPQDEHPPSRNEDPPPSNVICWAEPPDPPDQLTPAQTGGVPIRGGGGFKMTLVSQGESTARQGFR